MILKLTIIVSSISKDNLIILDHPGNVKLVISTFNIDLYNFLRSSPLYFYCNRYGKRKIGVEGIFRFLCKMGTGVWYNRNVTVIYDKRASFFFCQPLKRHY